MKEEWRNIIGYEQKYQISNIGKVKSLNYHSTKRNGLLRFSKNHRGYFFVRLSKGCKVKTITVHRLVALAFLPNPHNYPQINHKDENKLNNRVDNLEWCTASYNQNYGTRNERTMLVECNPIIGIDIKSGGKIYFS